MSGMIRLRPTQILLTSEEASKALHQLHPAIIGSPLSPATLRWGHNITVRRTRNAKEANQTTQDFTIHEDPPVDSRETEGGAADGGEISDMSDFSFGPILFRRGLSDRNTLFTEANSSSEAGDEGNDDERSTGSTSWDERKSATTITSDNLTGDNFVSSALIDGSISSVDEEQNLIWEANSDLAGNEPRSVQGESFIDIEYMADVELSVPEGSSSSAQDSDQETHFQESYSLPMDGEGEETISQRFEEMNLYASPAAPRDSEGIHSWEFSVSETPGTPGTPASASLPPTPPSLRRLLEEVSPRLDEVAGLSPHHAAVSRARLARYRSRSLQHSVLMGQAADFQVIGGYRRRTRTAGASQQWLPDNSPLIAHVRRRVVTIGVGSMADGFYGTNTDDSDGGIEIVGQVSETGILIDEGKESKASDLGSRREDTAKKVFG